MISCERFNRYELHDHLDAYKLLPDWTVSDVEEWAQKFSFDKEDILKSGGNKSDITKRIEAVFRRQGWDMEQKCETTTHKIDALKGKVALEIEWSNKDPFFDRDLSAFKHLFEAGRIIAGIIITRSSVLVPLFKTLESEGLSTTKYGASTTHTGKLLPKLKKGGAGFCPVFVIGITPNQYKGEAKRLPDWLTFSGVQQDESDRTISVPAARTRNLP